MEPEVTREFRHFKKWNPIPLALAWFRADRLQPGGVIKANGLKRGVEEIQSLGSSPLLTALIQEGELT